MRVSLSHISRKASPPRLTDSEPSGYEPELPAATDTGRLPSDRFQFSVGAAVLAGVSLLGVACNSAPSSAAIEAWVEAPPQGEICLKNDSPAVRVIVVDNFWEADKNTTHGEIVEAELIRNHHAEGEDADIALERVHVSLWAKDHGIEAGKPGSLESYLRDHFAGRMSRDAEGLQKILDSDGPRGVIHQS